MVGGEGGVLELEIAVFLREEMGRAGVIKMVLKEVLINDGVKEGGGQM